MCCGHQLPLCEAAPDPAMPRYRGSRCRKSTSRWSPTWTTLTYPQNRQAVGSAPAPQRVPRTGPWRRRQPERRRHRGSPGQARQGTSSANSSHLSPPSGCAPAYRIKPTAQSGFVLICCKSADGWPLIAPDQCWPVGPFPDAHRKLRAVCGDREAIRRNDPQVTCAQVRG